MLNVLDKEILAAIQDGLPMTQTPYADLAAAIGISTDQLLVMLNDWKQKGYIRRVGAVVNHFQMGLSSGALVAWDVPAREIDRIGALFASFAEVSHAYQRPASTQWPYSFYTMVHASSEEQLCAVVMAMSRAGGIASFQRLSTVKELKKTTPVYTVSP